VDYHGGIFTFRCGIEDVMPRTGEVVGFDCGPECEHEVTTIDSGARYSMAIWVDRPATSRRELGVTLI
jgi:hypothetical protein